MRTLLGVLFALAGICSAFYISIWWGIVQPIYDICRAVDNHTISGMVIASAVLKFIVRDVIALVVGGVLILLGVAVGDFR
jgi:hypothetical protein